MSVSTLFLLQSPVLAFKIIPVHPEWYHLASKQPTTLNLPE